MTIEKDKLVIVKSADMSDNDTGGGLPSKEIVVSGKSNEIFDDVSYLQATAGGISLRKVFLATQTDTAEKLTASRSVITEPCSNKNVSVFMIAPTAWADTRKEIVAKLTSYLAVGSRFAGHLLETQLAEQSMIQLSLDPLDTLPNVDDTLVLIQNEGQVDEFQQFVRITKVTSKERRFQIAMDRTVNRIVATLEISEALRKTFVGLTVQEFYQNASSIRRAIVHETVVAKANKIYSACKLIAPIVANTTQTLNLESIFTHVIPSSQSPEALTGINPAMVQKSLIKGSNTAISKTQTVNVTPAQMWFIGSGVYPGSVTLNVNGKTLTDGKGELKDISGVSYATIDYNTGQITWSVNANFGSQSVTINYLPAGRLSQFGNTDVILVPKTNANKVYVTTLQTTPSPLTITVSYQYNGRVYTLRDDGAGKLYNPSNSADMGTVDYATRDLVLTTAAIPDAGSFIIVSYGISTNTHTYADATAQKATLILDINDKTIFNNSLTVTWADKTAKANAQGRLSGDATGYVLDGKIYLTPTVLPAKDTPFMVSYNKGEAKSESQDIQVQTGEVIINLAGTNPIIKNSVAVNCLLYAQNEYNRDYYSLNVTIKDDGNGNMIVARHTPVAFANWVGQNIGSIDYANRQIILQSNLSYTTNETRWAGYSDVVESTQPLSAR